MKLTEVLKEACQKFGCKENSKIAKLYNKNAIQLFNEDLVLLSNGDIVYLAVKGTLLYVIVRIGEDFNFSAILDDY